MDAGIINEETITCTWTRYTSRFHFTPWWSERTRFSIDNLKSVMFYAVTRVRTEYNGETLG